MDWYERGTLADCIGGFSAQGLTRDTLSVADISIGTVWLRGVKLDSPILRSKSGMMDDHMDNFHSLAPFPYHRRPDA